MMIFINDSFSLSPQRSFIIKFDAKKYHDHGSLTLIIIKIPITTT